MIALTQDTLKQIGGRGVDFYPLMLDHELTKILCIRLILRAKNDATSYPLECAL